MGALYESTCIFLSQIDFAFRASIVPLVLKHFTARPYTSFI